MLSTPVLRTMATLPPALPCIGSSVPFGLVVGHAPPACSRPQLNRLNGPERSPATTPYVHHGLCICTRDLHCSPLCASYPPRVYPRTAVHNARAPGSQTLIAHSDRWPVGPSERLTAALAGHNMVRASPRPALSRQICTLAGRCGLSMPSPSSSRVGSACGIRPACYHPEGFHTGARSPVGGSGGWPKGGGGSRTPTYMAYNDRLVALIILRYICWGKKN